MESNAIRLTNRTAIALRRQAGFTVITDDSTKQVQ